MDDDVVLFMRPTVRLCALLGLKLDFLDRLETFPGDDFHHRSLRYWITIFLQNNSKSVSTEKTSVSLELLDSIGFDPLSTAVETIIARSSKGNDTLFLVEVCEWAEIFIRDEFNYNPLLSSRKGKFPFQRDLTNSWFQRPITNYD